MANERIVSSLMHPLASAVNFQLLGSPVLGIMNAAVAGKIGKTLSIRRQAETPGGPSGGYNPRTRTLTISSLDPNYPATVREWAHLIHEATHVAGHIMGRALKPVDEEVLGYTAECMFEILALGVGRSIKPADVTRDAAEPAQKRAYEESASLCRRRSEPEACEKTMETAAQRVAAMLLQRQSPDGGLLNELRNAIANRYHGLIDVDLYNYQKYQRP